jgi:Zn ribbon nucleic-acid-binding protein
MQGVLKDPGSGGEEGKQSIAGGDQSNCEGKEKVAMANEGAIGSRGCILSGR